MSLQQNINVSMNVTSAVNEAEKLADTLDKLGGRFEELKSITKKFDEAGNAIGATLKGIAKNGGEISRTFAVDASGSVNLLSESIRKAESQAKVSATSVAAIMRKELGSIAASKEYANATLAEKLDFKTKAAALQNTLKELSVASGRELGSLMTNVSNNVIGTYSKPIDAIQNKIFKLRDSMRELGSESRDVNSKIQLELAAGRNRQAVSTFLGNNTPMAVGTSAKEFAAINSAVARVVAITEQHKIQVGQVDAMWRNVSTGGLKTYMSKDLSQLQTALQAVKNAHEKMGQSAQQAAQSTKQAGQETNNLFNGENIKRFLEMRLAYEAFNQLRSAIQGGISDAIKLEEQIAKIKTLTQDTSSIEKWSDSIHKISGKSGLGELDVAASYYEALSNQIGNTVAEIETFTEASIKFGKVTGANAMQSNQLLSSVINAYGFSVTDTERISAQLFKAIDLGRVSVDELANSFGRTAVPAALLGVKMEELLGGISQLTIQGVKTADAQTQMLNLMNKLIKPTDEMTVFLNKLGFSSGEQAVKVLGFTNVLAELRKEYERGGLAQLGKELNDIRGFRGAIGILGDFTNYIDYVKKIKDGEEEYARASKIVFDNNATNIQRNIEKIKNSFTTMGQKFIQGILDITQVFGGRSGGLANVVNGLTESVIALAAGFSVLGLAASRTAVTGAFAGLAAFAVTPFGAAAIGVAALVTAVTAYFRMHKDESQRYIDNVERMKEADKDRLDASIVASNKYASKLADNMSAAMQTVNDGIRKGIQALDVQFEALENNTKTLRNNMLIGFESDMSAVNAAISATKSESEKAQRAADRAADQLKTLKEQYKDSDFRDALENADPRQRMTLMGNKFNELLNGARSEKDTIVALEMIKEANKLLTDAQQENKRNLQDRTRLEKDLGNTRNKLQDEYNALAIRQREINEGNGQNRLRELNEAVMDAQRKINQTQQEISELESKRNSLAGATTFKGTRQNIIDAHESVRKAQSDDASAKVQSGTVRAREQENLSIQITQIFKSLTDQVKGDIKSFEKYKDKDGKYMSPEKYSDDLAKKFNDLNDMLDKAGVSEDQRKLTIEANTAMIKTLIETYRITTAKDTANSKIEENIKMADVFRERVTKLGTDEANAKRRLATANYGISSPDASSNIQAILESIRNAQTIDSIRKLSRGIGSANNAVRAADDANNDSFTSTRGGTHSLSDNDLAKIYAAIGTKIQALQSLDQVSTQYTAMIDSSMREFGVDITQSMVATAANVNALQTNTTTMQQLIDTFRGFNITIDGKTPEKRASGGMIHGSDSVSALLSPGEFVMNRQATRQFSSQIASMNSGMWKFGADRGSNVSVGNVNVTLNSSGSNAVDAVQIGKMIQREVRRGLVKLS